MRKLKIAFVLQSRFEAFELALALNQRGHDVTVFINYPAFALKRFHMNPAITKRLVSHGIVCRIFSWLHIHFGMRSPEKFLHQWFGKWAARQLEKERWDAVFGMSGISLEFLRAPKLKDTFKVVIRASAHIRAQASILAAEEKRVGVWINKPSQWIIVREELEYRLADKIRVLSHFSYDSFIDQGVDACKVWMHPSAFPREQLKASPTAAAQRRMRVLEGMPLRVLYVGNLSYQKGMFDLREISKRVDGKVCEFHLVGEPLPETASVFSSIPTHVVLHGKKDQAELAMFYERADLFIYPTLQDGFPQVLAQAYAAGLPVLATTNSSAPDFIEEGVTGCIFPACRPDLFAQKIIWYEKNRSELVKMIDAIAGRSCAGKVRSWCDAAQETEKYLSKQV